MSEPKPIFGRLAAATGRPLLLGVQKSRAGYYLGTFDDEGPFTRESVEYWPTQSKAARALQQGQWTQRPSL